MTDPVTPAQSDAEQVRDWAGDERDALQVERDREADLLRRQRDKE